MRHTVGLGQDMNRINDGIWHEDYEMVGQGAPSVAGHARVTPGEIPMPRHAVT